MLQAASNDSGVWRHRVAEMSRVEDVERDWRAETPSTRSRLMWR